MDLVNPFEEVVVFGKAYPVAWPPPGARSTKALLPTGRHVSHENALSHTHNSGGGGGPATRLERYGHKRGTEKSKLFHHGSRKNGPAKGLERTTHTSRGFKPGPFKKAFEEVDVEKGILGFGARAAKKKQVARGLRMAAGPDPSVARGLKMAAGNKGVAPSTGRTGENVIAPARRNSMAGQNVGEVGSKYVLTSRYFRNR